MELADPKVRTGAIETPLRSRRLQPRDTFLLHLPERLPEPARHCSAAVAIACQLSEDLGQLRVGDRVLVDDGKFAAVVEAAESESGWLRVVRMGPKGCKLKTEKALKLPDTALGLTVLTNEDCADLPHAVKLADLVGSSFVQNVADTRTLQDAMAGLTPESWQRAPLSPRSKGRGRSRTSHRLLSPLPVGRLRRSRDRGQLRASRRMQEELMWLWKAAHVPLIRATQVLEQLVKKARRREAR